MEYSPSFPIVLSVKVALLALLIVAPIGIAVAWVQARHDYRGRGVVDALIVLPMVLPPTVVGYFLILMLGRRGVIGSWLEALFHLRLVFTPAAAVIASAIAAFPLVVKTLQPALEAVPAELEAVGRSLGLNAVAVFFRVTLPWAWQGLAAGLVLALARAVGEFGATLMFAGNIPGVTNTMPLEIFAAYQAGDDGRALRYVAVLTVLSAAVALLAARLAPREVRG
jgi:molybdate transport system permease protein